MWISKLQAMLKILLRNNNIPASSKNGLTI